MADFRPLALRTVAQEWVEEVASPALRAMNPAERRQHLIDHPNSYRHVTRSPEDLDDPSKWEAEVILAEGRRALARLISDGIFSAIRPATYYIYELSIDDHSQVGIVGGAAICDYESGLVRIHERVHSERAAHLTEHLEMVGVQSSPISMAYRPNAPLDELAQTATEDHPPLLRFTSGDGVEQKIWAVTNADAITAIGQALEAEPLYLIDGHHRAHAAFEARASFGDDESMLSVVFPADQLMNRPYHRWLEPAVDVSGFIAEVTARHPVRVAGDLAEVEGRTDREIALYGLNQWYLVDLPLIESARSVQDRLANLDPVRLQNNLFGPILGIDGTNPGDGLAYRPGVRSISELKSVVDSENGMLAYMRAAPIDVLLDTADASLVMPPKSTYFEPKARSGLFVRQLPEK